MLAASSSENYSAEGPEAVIQDLRTTFGLVITIILTIGTHIFFCFFSHLKFSRTVFFSNFFFLSFS